MLLALTATWVTNFKHHQPSRPCDAVLLDFDTLVPHWSHEQFEKLDSPLRWRQFAFYLEQSIYQAIDLQRLLSIEPGYPCTFDRPQSGYQRLLQFNPQPNLNWLVRGVRDKPWQAHKIILVDNNRGQGVLRRIRSSQYELRGISHWVIQIH
jgi:hypothetical protein